MFTPFELYDSTKLFIKPNRLTHKPHVSFSEKYINLSSFENAEGPIKVPYDGEVVFKSVRVKLLQMLLLPLHMPQKSSDVLPSHIPAQSKTASPPALPMQSSGPDGEHENRSISRLSLIILFIFSLAVLTSCNQTLIFYFHYRTQCI